MSGLRILFKILIVCLLTLLTQIGGLLFLLCFPLFRLLRAKVKNLFLCYLYQTIAFLSIYLLLTFTLVPFLARPLGRVPMPIYSNASLSPLTYLTVLLNRHYVRPELRKTMEKVSRTFTATYPGSTVLYLDANFPFINRFPLLPHLSHSDGKKLDLAFCYLDKRTRKVINGAPSWMGYGVCEAPEPGEENMPARCAEKGYWQYSLLKKLVSAKAHQYYLFDQERTSYLIRLLSKAKEIRKLFIEPHLKQRLGLAGISKIRFQGCQAVRHDDHLHIQL